MLTFTLLDADGCKVAINPMHVVTVMAGELGNAVVWIVGDQGVTELTESFDDVVRKLTGALLTREIHA